MDGNKTIEKKLLNFAPKNIKFPNSQPLLIISGKEKTNKEAVDEAEDVSGLEFD